MSDEIEYVESEAELSREEAARRLHELADQAGVEERPRPRARGQGDLRARCPTPSASRSSSRAATTAARSRSRSAGSCGRLRPARAGRASRAATSKRTGVVPGSSPSTSTGSGCSGVTATRATRRSSTRGSFSSVPRYMRWTLRASAALPTSPMIDDVEQAVVGLGLRGDLDAAAELPAVHADDVVRHHVARLAVELDVEADVLPRRERRRPWPTGTPTVPPSFLEEAFARVATSPVSPHDACWRRGAVSSPPPSAAWQVTRPTSMRARPALGEHPQRALDLLRDAVRADEVAARAALDDAQGRPVAPSGWPCSSAKPLTTSLTVPSPPTATTSSSPARSASRVSTVACPGPSVRSSRASRPRRAARRRAPPPACRWRRSPTPG